MQTYTIHEPPEGSADRIERAESLVFVKDGFSLVAAALPPLWMLANRLWLALLIYVAALVGFELLAWIAGMGQQAVGWVIAAAHLLIGLEADSIRRWSLARSGHRLIGSVTGRGSDDCERHFFEAWLKDQPFVSPAALAGQSSAAGSRGTGGRLNAMALWQGR